MPYPYNPYVGQGVYIPSYTPPVAPYNPYSYHPTYYAPRPAASYNPWTAKPYWNYGYPKSQSYYQSYMGSPQYTQAGYVNPRAPASKPPVQAQYVGQGVYQTDNTVEQRVQPAQYYAHPNQPTLEEQHAYQESHRGLAGQEEWYQYRALEALKNMPTGTTPAPQAAPAPAYGGGGYGGYGGYGGGGAGKAGYYQAQPKQSYYRGSPVPFTPDVAQWLYNMVTWNMRL